MQRIRLLAVAALMCATVGFSQPSYWFQGLERQGSAQLAQQYFFLPGTNVLFTYAANHVIINSSGGGGTNPGPQGPVGPAGPTGPAGAHGTNGTNGVNGINGTNGATGPQGPAGSQGPSGATTISLTNTVTGAPGSSALVTNLGDSTNLLLRFTIPSGSNGANGTSGTNGLNGTNGVNGTNGINGTNGLPGAKGTNASIIITNTITGSPGTSASVTNLGTTNFAVLRFTVPAGSNGVAGTNGTNGVNGSNSPTTFTSVTNSLGYLPATNAAIIPISQLSVMPVTNNQPYLGVGTLTVESFTVAPVGITTNFLDNNGTWWWSNVVNHSYSWIDTNQNSYGWNSNGWHSWSNGFLRISGGIQTNAP